MVALKLSFAAGLALLLGLPAAAHAEQDCAALAGLSLPGARIILAQDITDGIFQEDTAVERAQRTYKGMPPFCRVRGIATPVPGSQVGFEVWLPHQGWTNRLHMVGNGAYASNLHYALMRTRLLQGDVAVGTDTGHKGSDLTFVIGKPESIVDFSHRAVHVSVTAAKAVTQAYYAKPADYAYFSGCSTGGYQGLSEAQRYPDDFDGILAGAPGNNRTHLTLAFLWQFKANRRPGDDTTPIVPQEKLPMITRAALKACDRLDGVADDVINDPGQCTFDVGSLQCKAGNGPDCLTAEQVTAVRLMYRGPVDTRTGKPLYPGYPVGSEGIMGKEDEAHPGWSAYWANPKKPDEPLRLDFFRYWVFNDPNWAWKSFNWGSDIDDINNRIGATFNAIDPDLDRFRAGGGKMIMFMGWQDPVGAAGEAINYYQDVAARSTAADRDRDTQSFLRLYMVPGMAHCAGGPGATAFSTGTRDSEPPVIDARHDMVTALQQWVEKGKAPEELIATRFEGEKPDRRIAFQRPLCVYPKVIRYKGGPTEKAESYSCVEVRQN